MSWRPSFEEALAILEIAEDAGVRGAKRGYYLMLQKYGPEPSADMMTRFNAAWEVLQDESVWPKAAAPAPAPRPSFGGGELDDLRGEPPRRRQLPPGHQKSDRDRRAIRSGGPPSIRDHQDVEDLLAGAPNPPPRQRPPSARAATRTEPDDELAFGAPAPGTASGASDVAEALQRLGKCYRQVLDLDRLVASLDASDDTALTSMLFERIDAGHPMAAAAALCALLDLMVTDPERRWLRPRGVMRVAMQLHERGVTDPKCLVAARPVQRGWERWAEATEIDRATLDLSTSNRVRIATALTELPDDFPSPLRAALAQAGNRGEVRSARPAFEQLAASDHDQAANVRRLLGRHAPGLLNDFGDVLPTARKAAPPALAAQWGLPPWAIPAVLIASTVCALSFWYFLSDRDFDAGAAAEHEAARHEICEYLGEGRPGCVWARIVGQAIAEEGCSLLKRAVPMMLGAVNNPKRRRDARAYSPAELQSVRKQAARLAADAKARCPE